MTYAQFRIFFSFLFLFAFYCLPTQAEQEKDRQFENGKILFLNNCNICHQVSHEVIGPALVNINKKRSTEWLINFIQNSQDVICSNDTYALNLFEQYNHTVMPPFEHKLSENEISSILYYINEVSLNGGGLLEEELYPVQEARALQGKVLFGDLCSMCHALDKEIYGPGLASVGKRHRSAWLVSFIQNSQGLIASGDVYANDLYKAYDQKKMPAFQHLSNKELEALITYLSIAASSPVHTEGVNGRNINQGPDPLSVRANDNGNITSKKAKINGETYTLFKYILLVIVLISAIVHAYFVLKMYKMHS